MKHVITVVIGAALHMAAAAQDSLPPVTDAVAAPAAPPAESATLLFRSTGEPMNVRFAMSREPEACRNLLEVGKVYDAETERRILLPFIAKLNRKTRRATGVDEEVEKKIAGGSPVQVYGDSDWASSGVFASSGSCGPLVVNFTPQNGHKYLVEFAFVSGRRCTQNVFDITVPEQKVKVEDVARYDCAKLKA